MRDAVPAFGAHPAKFHRLARLARLLGRCTVALCATLLFALAPDVAFAERLLVGPGGHPMSLGDALGAARDGDEIDLLPGEYKEERALIEKKRITLRGRGGRAVFLGAGKAVEGRALMVIRDADVTLENIDFRGLHLRDGTGAGVRFDKGRLRVVNCQFVDNDLGLITGNDPAAELEIRDSLFAQSPHVEGGLFHLLYVGRIAKFRITGSRLASGFEGHLLKSRARESFVGYNMLRDGPDGSASYELEFPSGGAATVIGNVISKGASAQHPVMVSFGADGKLWERNALVLAHNTLASDGWRPTWFLRIYRDRLPGMEEPLIVNNLVVGSGIFWLGTNGQFEGNWPATLGMLADASALAYELAPGSWLRGRAKDPRAVRGMNLAPTHEFTFPVGTREISTDRSRWTPGAYQR